jgi:hypothetical protein
VTHHFLHAIHTYLDMKVGKKSSYRNVCTS